MIPCNFNGSSMRGKSCNNPPETGDVTIVLSLEQCADFVEHPTRYMWDGSQLVEWLGWQEEEAAQKAAEELAAWRKATKCGPLQMRRALRATGLLELVKSFMLNAPEEVVEAWEYATEIYRLDPFVMGIQSSLQKTDIEVDDLFKLALTFA